MPTDARYDKDMMMRRWVLANRGLGDPENISKNLLKTLPDMASVGL